MSKPSASEIIASLKRDEVRLSEIEALPPAIQQQYAQGIDKLRRRILEERAAVGMLPDDTEAWRYWLLDDFDYDAYPPNVRDHINQYLALVEDAREDVSFEDMTSRQRQLEQYVHDIQEPQQLKLEA